MKNNPVPTTLYAIIAGVLGVFAISGALIWKNAVQANAASGEVIAGGAAVALLTTMLLFLGIFLILAAVVLLILGVMRKREDAEAGSAPDEPYAMPSNSQPNEQQTSTPNATQQPPTQTPPAPQQNQTHQPS